MMMNDKLFSIYKKNSAVIDECYFDYQYAGISKEEYKEWMFQFMIDAMDKTSDDESIVVNVKSNLIEWLKKMLQDKDICFKTLNNYINCLCPSQFDENQCISFFDNFNNFIQKYKIEYYKMIDLLLKENPLFYNLVASIYDGYVRNSLPVNVLENEVLKYSLEIFASLDNVDLDDQDAENYVNDVVKAYIREAKKIPLLTAKEEIELGERIQNGDDDAKKRFIEANLRLVLKNAWYFFKKNPNCGMEFFDLIQEGNLGLIKAVELFDVNKGCKFSTHATWWIRHAITYALAKHGRMVRIPNYRTEEIIAFNKAVNNLQKELGRNPSDKEIAEYMNVSQKKIKEIMMINSNTFVASLNQKIGSGDDELDKELGAVIPSADNLEDLVSTDEFIRNIRDLLSVLNETERFVIERSFGFYDYEKQTLQEIALELGVSRERVRQIEAKALMKLRNIPEIQEFVVYLNHPDGSLEKLFECIESYNKYRNFSLVKKILSGEKSTRGKHAKSLYEVFYEYSEEEIKSAVSELSLEEQQLVFKKFGNDFMATESIILSNYEKGVFYRVIRRKLIDILEKNSSKGKTTLVKKRKKKS